MPETIKLPKVRQLKMKMVPHLETTEAILVHCNIVTYGYQ